MHRHEIIDQMVNELGVLVWPAGSRYTVDPEPQTSDFDWIVYSPNKGRLDTWLRDHQFCVPDMHDIDRTPSGGVDESMGTEPWLKLDGDDKINLIVTTSLETAKQWVAGRDWCKEHNIKKRWQRIQAHRYFRGLEGELPELDNANEIN